MKSDNVKKGIERAPHRSLFKAMGYTDIEMNRPLIGIASSENSIVPGHTHLDKIVEAVKAGVYMAGGTPLVFNTIGVCDGIAMNHEGMKYSLASREIIADSVVHSIPTIGSLEEAIEQCEHGSAWLNRTTTSPQDIAESVAFLCSDAGSFISGAVNESFDAIVSSLSYPLKGRQSGGEVCRRGGSSNKGPAEAIQGDGGLVLSASDKALSIAPSE